MTPIKAILGLPRVVTVHEGSSLERRQIILDRFPHDAALRTLR